MESSSDVEMPLNDNDVENHANGVENGEEKESDAPQNSTDADGFKEDDQYPIGRVLFIPNLPSTLIFTYADELTNVFKKYGEIKSIKRDGIIVNGLGTDIAISAYITFVNPECTEKALVENGTIVGGSPITVTIIKAGPFTIKIDNLPVRVSTECLRNLLKPCGSIKEINKIPARRIGLFIAFVEFEDEEGLNKALTLNGKLMVNSVKLSFVKHGVETVPKKSSKMSGKKKSIDKNIHGEKSNRDGMREWGPGWQGNNRPPYRVPRGGMGNRAPHWGNRGGARPFRGGGGGSGGGGNNYNNYW